MYADMYAETPPATAERPTPRGAGLTIADGGGGHLALDLRCGELRWLADACRRLMSGALPQGASAIKVRAAEKCYLVNSATAADGGPRITIVNLFDPGERVALTSDVAAVVAALIEDGVGAARRSDVG